MIGKTNGKFKKVKVLAAFSLLAGIGYLALPGAGQETGEAVAAATPQLWEGTVYSATRGGHMVYTNIAIDTERQMVSGSVAGMMRLPNRNQADAIEISPDQTTIYYPTWDSTLYTVDITGDQPELIGEGKWFDKETRTCGSHFGPDGKLYLSVMMGGNIHALDIADPANPKLADQGYKTTYLCGVQVTANQKEIWTSDMRDSTVYVYDPKTRKQLNKIEFGDEFLHRSRWSPDGKRLYQSSTGSKTPVANGRFHIIDAAKKKIIDTIVLGHSYDVHDVILTPDEKYAILPTRRVPADQYKDSELIVVNLETKKPIGSISMCASCHNGMGFEPPVTPGREVFICGGQVAWKK